MATATLAPSQKQATLPLRRHMVESEMDKLFRRLKREVRAFERDWDDESTPYRELVRTLEDRYVDEICLTDGVLLMGVAAFLKKLGIEDD